MQNLGVIKGVHRNGIHLLVFFKEDEFIASCGIRQNSPILIYNVKDLSLVLSTFSNERVVDIDIIHNYSGALY